MRPLWIVPAALLAFPSAPRCEPHSPHAQGGSCKVCALKKKDGKLASAARPASPALPAARIPTHEWRLDESYQGRGAYTDAHKEATLRIPKLVAAAQNNIALRLGVAPRKKFRYPLTIRFSDMNAPASFHQWGSVQATAGPSGDIALQVNLSSYGKQLEHFNENFTHDMAHVILADVLGPKAFRKAGPGTADAGVPDWFVEGVTQWACGQGRESVKADAMANYGRAEQVLLGELDAPRNPALYSQYFLAVEYIARTKGPGAIHGLIKDLAASKPLKASLKTRLGQDWETFKANVRSFSAGYIRKVEAENPLSIDLGQ